MNRIDKIEEIRSVLNPVAPVNRVQRQIVPSAWGTLSADKEKGRPRGKLV
jgi:hypothetical protein